MKIKGMAFTILSAIIFGATPILGSMTYDMGSSPETLTFYRSLMAIPVLLAIVVHKKISLKVTKSQLKTIIMVVVFGSTATTVMLYSSYQFIGVGAATTLHFLYPVFVVLLCRVFYKEKIDRVKIITLVIACLGMLFFFENTGTGNILGLVLALVSGVNYAFYMVEVDKKGLKTMEPQKLAFYFACLIPVTMLIYNLFTGSINFVMEPKAYLFTFIVSMSASVFAVMMLQIGIRELGSGSAAIFSMFEPITGLICGWLFLGESMTVQKILGSVIIIIAVTFLVTADKFVKKPEKAAVEA